MRSRRNQSQGSSAPLCRYLWIGFMLSKLGVGAYCVAFSRSIKKKLLAAILDVMIVEEQEESVVVVNFLVTDCGNLYEEDNERDTRRTFPGTNGAFRSEVGHRTNNSNFSHKANSTFNEQFPCNDASLQSRLLCASSRAIQYLGRLMSSP